MKREVEYLGFVIGSNEVRASKMKTAAVSKFKIKY